MVNNMISTICFSICGYFNYPIIENSLILNFIRRVSDTAQFDAVMELVDISKDKIDHSLLFNSGDYKTIYSTNLNLLESKRYTPLSVNFKNKYDVTSEIILNPVDGSGYELAYMLEEEELDISNKKWTVIQECAHNFFETFNPLYGCCGTEMFTENVEHIKEKDIINSKFYYIGYIDFRVLKKFDFLTKENNKHFLIKPLKNGNMYINVNTIDTCK